MSQHLLDDAPLSPFHKRLALFASGGPYGAAVGTYLVPISLTGIGIGHPTEAA